MNIRKFLMKAFEFPDETPATRVKAREGLLLAEKNAKQDPDMGER